jgi:hypothetical protein
MLDSSDTVAVPPARGTVRTVSGRLEYLPLPGFSGTDAFTVARCVPDRPDLCGTADVVVTVADPGDALSAHPGAGTRVEPAAAAHRLSHRLLAITGLVFAVAGAVLFVAARGARGRRDT